MLSGPLQTILLQMTAAQAVAGGLTAEGIHNLALQTASNLRDLEQSGVPGELGQALRPIRRLLEQPQTERDGLGALDTFVRHLRDGSPRPETVQPPPASSFWMLAAMVSSRPTTGRRRSAASLQKEWTEALSTALIDVLRWRHTRHSPTGQSGMIPFRVDFDPRTGKVIKVVLVNAKREEAPAEGEASVRIVYSIDLRMFFLEGAPIPSAIRVAPHPFEEPGNVPRQVEPISEPHSQEVVSPHLSVPPDLAPPSSNIVSAIASLQGREMVFKKPEIRRSPSDGGEVIEINPPLFEENIAYATRAMAEMSGGRMTIAVSPVTLRSEGFPLPRIYVSVAPNGAFVGFAYEMPEEHSPRGTVYEIGTPSMGTLALVRYAVFQNPGKTSKVKVPVGFVWQPPGTKPNRLQRLAVTRWQTAAARAAEGWTKTRDGPS